MILWLISFGLISGITTWLFGFGGGFVTVPLLYTLILTLWAGDSLAGEHAYAKLLWLPLRSLCCFPLLLRP
ncbi:Uncharacterised protein [Proteus mirabilis]|uniref:Uncharacterized protein n=1 Tax=Proteus mirabilis TaxID=584 RepID=A0A379GFV3_PROMI|nr:Uncharacterised protein [Proteus mirabilis]